MSNYSSQQSFPPVPPIMARTSTLAIISLIAGICTWSFVPGVAAIVAIITGHMAKSEIRKSGGAITGNGMATAGLALGYVQVAILACLCLVWVLMMVLGITIPFLSIPFLATPTGG